MDALTRPAGVVYRAGGPVAAGDRRLALFIALSVLLHLPLALDWGHDSGRRPAQMPSTITARLAPAADPLVEGVLALAQAQADLALAATEGAPGSVPVPAPEPVPALPPEPAPTPAPMPPPPVPEPSPAPPLREAVEPLPDPTVKAPLAGSERDGAPDLNWYTGRDLDILPRALAPIEPAFPLNAQLRGVSGKVTLSLSIDAAGRVVEVSVVRAEPPGFFEDAALVAFRAAPFAPGIRNGRAVRSRVQTVVVFELGPR